jgi:hypothetical protein
MDSFLRLFGVTPVVKKPPPVPPAQAAAYESIFRSQQDMERLDAVYLKNILAISKKIKILCRAGQLKVAELYFVHLQKIEAFYEKHTQLKLCVDSVVEHVRTSESIHITLEGMEKSLLQMKATTNTVNVQNAERLLEQLEVQQRQVAETQKIMSKPIAGMTPKTVDQQQLESDLDDFLARPDYDEEEEEDAPVVTAALPRKPVSVSDKREMEIVSL